MKRKVLRAVEFLQEHWWILVLSIVIAVVGIVLSLNQGPDTGPTETVIVERDGQQVIEERSGGRDVPGWAFGTAFLSLAFGIGAVVVLIVDTPRRRLREPDARHRLIEELSKSLRSANATIEAITKEVEDGDALLKRLEAELADRSQLAQLSDAEAGAVHSEVRRIVRSETSRGTRHQVVIAIVSFVLGVVATIVTSVLLGN